MLKIFDTLRTQFIEQFFNNSNNARELLENCETRTLKVVYKNIEILIDDNKITVNKIDRKDI